jgi:hypothetical protein
VSVIKKAERREKGSVADGPYLLSIHHHYKSNADKACSTQARAIVGFTGIFSLVIHCARKFYNKLRMQREADKAR